MFTCVCRYQGVPYIGVHNCCCCVRVQLGFAYNGT